MSQLEPRQQAFRNAMAHLSAAVNVITSNGPAGRCGIMLSVEESAAGLVAAVEDAAGVNACRFVDYRNQPLPW